MFYNNSLNRKIRNSFCEKRWKVIRNSHDYLVALVSVLAAVLIPDINIYRIQQREYGLGRLTPDYWLSMKLPKP